MFDRLVERGFEISFASHAAAILGTDFPDIVRDLKHALLGVSLPITEIVGSGGGEAQLTQRLRRRFHDLGWRKRNVEMKKVVDGIEKESISHEIDHFHATDRGNFALEIEWNNKDPFFDRDLENYKRLHAEGVIGVGAIVTRGSALQAGLQDMIRGWAGAGGRAGVRGPESAWLQAAYRTTGGDRQGPAVARRELPGRLVRDVLQRQIRNGDDALVQIAGSRASRRRQSLPAGPDRLATGDRRPHCLTSQEK